MTLSNYIYLCLWLSVYNENVPDFENATTTTEANTMHSQDTARQWANEWKGKHLFWLFCFFDSTLIFSLCSILLASTAAPSKRLTHSFSLLLARILHLSLSGVFFFSTTLHHSTGYFMAITYYQCISDVTIVICSVPSALYCFLFIKPMVKSKQNSFTTNGFDTNFWGTFKRMLTRILLETHNYMLHIQFVGTSKPAQSIEWSLNNYIHEWISIRFHLRNSFFTVICLYSLGNCGCKSNNSFNLNGTSSFGWQYGPIINLKWQLPLIN